MIKAVSPSPLSRVPAMRRIQRPSRPLRFLPLRTPPRTAAGFFPPHRPAARLTADGRRRVETYRLLACRVAWRFARRNARDVPTDELVAEALYALTYAAGLYDANRDVPFGAYASRVIRHC